MPAIAGVLLLLLAWIAYAPSFGGPFQFDDIEAIEGNASIRHLSLATLKPLVNGTGVASRPIVNLSLAINFAIGGMNPGGYHVFNFLLHVLSGLVLFDLVRRTLLQPALRDRFGAVALPVAWFVAGLWLVHPLQTESVTCVIQRTEGLVGFFYLVALYGFVRAVAESASRWWPIVTIGACLLGMASKEVMVSAPLLMLLYDRAFVAGTLAEAWRKRRGLYVAAAATWLLLGALVLHGGGSRGTAAGFGLGVTPWEYARKQCEAVLLYGRLAFWPHPLVVDYGYDLTVDPNWIGVQITVLVTLLAATGFALWRRPVLGFLGAWFFGFLAPSSSIVPLLTQTVAEHRMYLPLAALVVAVVASVASLRVSIPQRRISFALGLAVLGLFCVLTRLRNADYRSGIALWQDTVAKRPQNPRAWYNLGVELTKEEPGGEQAMASFREALRLDPGYADAHYALGLQLAKRAGGAEEAIAHYRAAVQAMPTHAAALMHLAVELSKQPGRLTDAIAYSERAVEVEPANAVAHNNLATLLLALPERRAEAITHYETSLRLRPNHPETHYNLANALAKSPDGVAAALEHYARALELRPDFVVARYNLANELAKLPGRLPEAIEQYEQILRIQPDHAEAHFNLAICLAKAGRPAEATRHFEAVLQLNPGSEAARRYLDFLRAGQ